jgi:hypothetical protein
MSEEFDEAEEQSSEMMINNVLIERAKRTEKDIRSYVS